MGTSKVVVDSAVDDGLHPRRMWVAAVPLMSLPSAAASTIDDEATTVVW